MAVSDTPSESEALPGIERRQRADAARNRERLLEAASLCFRERGLDVGVSEIAERAGIGRATLFRNFPTKQDLVIAIVVERTREAVERGRALLEAGEPRGEMLATLITRLAEEQQVDRALFEGIATEEYMASDEIRAIHLEMVDVLDALIAADHAAGTVRGDVGAFDVLMLVKGACKACVELSGDAGHRALARQLNLILAALSSESVHSCPLPGAPLTLEEFEQAHQCGAAPEQRSPGT